MARHWFGEQPADFVVAPGAQYDLTSDQIGYTAVLVPGARLWCYDYTSGVRTTDLLDASGSEASEITAAQYGRIPRFRGPDGARTLLLGQAEDDHDPDDPDAPELVRWVVTSTDWPALLAGVETRVGVLEDGGAGPGEVVATAHPLIWALDGEVDEDRTSQHPYWNIEGKAQQVTVVRAQATVVSGQVTCTVLTIDPDTGNMSTIAEVVLDEGTSHATASPDAPVSDGTGLTVRVELGDEADEVSDITVQVMIR